MMPFRRIFDEKRRFVIPVAAGLALNVILLAAVVYPLTVRVRGAEDRAQAAEASLAAAQREDQAARGLVQGRDRTDTALQSFYQKVLPNSRSSARQITYLRLAQLAEEHHLRSSHRSADVGRNAQGTLQRLRFTMALEGSYDDVRRFIYQLESGTDFIVIDSVALAEGADPGGSLQLTLALSTYFQPDPNGA
jgi:hypothetical protein